MSDLSRRDFLRWGAAAAGVAGLPLGKLGAHSIRPTAQRCLVVNLVGGPSQHETWDPKPDAPSEVRGPFGSIATAVPGVRFSELFPRIASQARKLAVIRSLHHDAAPIHETGMQLLQTGRLARTAPEFPAWFAWTSHLTGQRHLLLPGPIESTGVPTSHGQSFAFLGEPASLSRAALRDERYGKHRFGTLLSQARHALEHDVPFVTVNLATALSDQVSWDCHADGFCLNSTLEDYRSELAPAFDHAFATLLDDLAATDLLDSTLVVAQGEFGRTPHLNDRGGRDHWPAVWSVLLAGGGVQGGQVVGASDSFGGEPLDRPVHAGSMFATILHALGVDPAAIVPGIEGRPTTSCEHRPVVELF